MRSSALARGAFSPNMVFNALIEGERNMVYLYCPAKNSPQTLDQGLADNPSGKGKTPALCDGNNGGMGRTVQRAY